MNLNDSSPDEPVLQVTLVEPPPTIGVRIAAAMWGFVLPSVLMAGVFTFILWIVPILLAHWRSLDTQTDADALYAKRRAELKAEAEHADERLELLDKRVVLTSLGFREVARKVLPNVVHIFNYREPTKDDLKQVEERKRRLVYDPDDERKYVQQGLGSGVIFKPGIILTNHHVLRDAKRLRVTFATGRSIGVDIESTASDSPTDLAILRLPADMSPALKEEARQSVVFADSDKDVQVGDWTLAMGSPHDFKQTVTQGIISAKGRLLSLQDSVLVELLQTSAAIHPGNSGGPLFDQSGRVAGINVAVAEHGIGFAIPSNTVKRVGDLLYLKGEVPRGYLGIGMEDAPGPVIKAQKIDSGAIAIKEVRPKHAGAMAGLQIGDLIVGLNKETLSRLTPMQHFQQRVVDLPPGAELTLDIVRGDDRRQIVVTLGRRPKDLR